jgi:hypothetical protein
LMAPTLSAANGGIVTFASNRSVLFSFVTGGKGGNIWRIFFGRLLTLHGAISPFRAQTEKCRREKWRFLSFSPTFFCPIGLSSQGEPMCGECSVCLMSDKRGSTMEAEFRALLYSLLTGRAGYCFHHLAGGGVIPG